MKEALEMETIRKILLIILLLIFSVVVARCTSPQKIHSTPVAKEASDFTKTMYLKGGRIIQCDMVWEGIASQILCDKSGNIIGYSAGDVDLIRTFGESSAREIAKRHEQRIEDRKYRARISKPRIVTPEEEKRLRRKERLEAQKGSQSSGSSYSVPGNIKLRCEQKWGSNSEMVNYCIKNQRDAKREISGYTGTIRNNCESKWGSNYEMVLYCIKNQSAAKKAIDNTAEDEISHFCRNKWGQNYEMIDYCVKNQRAAKENIERNYSGYKRKRCEQKWGNNYQMIEYCIKNQ